jgi:hypothetical protein
MPAGMEEDASEEDDEDVFDYCGGGFSRPKPIPESEWTLPEVPRAPAITPKAPVPLFPRAPALSSAQNVAALSAPKAPVPLFPRTPALSSAQNVAALSAPKAPVQLFPRAPALSSAQNVAALPSAQKAPVSLFPRAPALPQKVAELPVAQKDPVQLFPRAAALPSAQKIAELSVAPKPDPVAVRVDIKGIFWFSLYSQLCFLIYFILWISVESTKYRIWRRVFITLWRTDAFEEINYYQSKGFTSSDKFRYFRRITLIKAKF